MEAETKVQVPVDVLTYLPLVEEPIKYDAACDVRAPNKSHISVDAGSVVRSRGGAHTVLKGRATAGFFSFMEIGENARGVAELPSLVEALPKSKVTVNGGAVARAHAHSEVSADDEGYVSAEKDSKVLAFPGSHVRAKSGSHVVLNGCTDIRVEPDVTLTTSGVLTTIANVVVHARKGSLILAGPGSRIYAEAGSRVIKNGGVIVHAAKDAVIVDKPSFWDNLRLIWSVVPTRATRAPVSERFYVGTH